MIRWLMNPDRSMGMSWSRTLPALAGATFLLLTCIASAVANAGHGRCQVSDEPGDDQYASIAKRVPAFGGFYVDGSSLNVWLTDDGESLDAAVQEILSLPEHHGLADLTPEALPARYSFLQLFCWHWYQMSAVPEPDGIILTDIDDAKNRLTVGVEDLAAQGPAVRAWLVEAGIPLEAVDIIEEEPFMLLPGPGESVPETGSRVPARIEVHETRSSAPTLAGIATGLVLAVGVSAAIFVRRRKRRADQGLDSEAPSLQDR
jgi:hypothetical protein